MRPIINLVDLSISHLERAAAIALDCGYLAIPFDSADTFLRSFDESVAGCTVLGLSGHFASSIDCLTRVRSLCSDTQVLMMANDWETNQVVHAMKLGASDIVPSDASKESFRVSIEAAVDADREIRRSKAEAIPEAILERLSAEDSRIFAAIVRGRTTKQVASELDISVRTVHYRKKALLEKIGVKDRSEAIELVRCMRKNPSAVA